MRYEVVRSLEESLTLPRVGLHHSKLWFEVEGLFRSREGESGSTSFWPLILKRNPRVLVESDILSKVFHAGTGHSLREMAMEPPSIDVRSRESGI